MTESPTPIDAAIISLRAIETDNMRWLRERSTVIQRVHAEMVAERNSNPNERTEHGIAA